MFLVTLAPLEYRDEIPELEKKIDDNFFQTTASNTFLRKMLYNQLWKIFVDFEVLKAKLDTKKKDMTPRSMSQKIPSQGGEGQGSIGTLGIQTSRRMNRNNHPPPSGTRRSNLVSSFARKGLEQNPVASTVGEYSFASVVIDILEAHEPMYKHDYLKLMGAYKNY